MANDNIVTVELDVNDPSKTGELTVAQGMELLNKGATIGELIGMDSKRTEILYALAYQLYNAGNYKDAETVFRALCVYDGAQVKFWMGMGGCLQNQGKYDEAAKIYAMGATMSGLQDPEPMYYAAQCFLKDKRRDDAMQVLEYCEIMGRKGNAHDDEFKERAANLLNLLKVGQK